MTCTVKTCLGITICYFCYLQGVNELQDPNQWLKKKENQQPTQIILQISEWRISTNQRQSHRNRFDYNISDSVKIGKREEGWLYRSIKLLKGKSQFAKHIGAHTLVCSTSFPILWSAALWCVHSYIYFTYFANLRPSGRRMRGAKRKFRQKIVQTLISNFKISVVPAIYPDK